MSRRVLARPLAAATLASALVLTPALAVADPGDNGKGGDKGKGTAQAPGQHFFGEDGGSRCHLQLGQQGGCVRAQHTAHAIAAHHRFDDFCIAPVRCQNENSALH